MTKSELTLSNDFLGSLCSTMSLQVTIQPYTWKTLFDVLVGGAASWWLTKKDNM